ncbi:MAG: SCO family protein [Solirubrobacteraceae bacterium]|nr:SCO family protein [Solirubrobacteraceae bacterium]
MHPRLPLALLVTLTVTLGLAVSLVLLRPQAVTPVAAAVDGVESAASPFAGPTRASDALAPPLRLRDQRGRIATLDEYRGAPLVVTFLYSTCRDTCPVAARQIAGALDRLDAPVPVIAVTVDPERDTPASAQRFVNRMGLRDRMRFLLGERDALRPIWRAYGIQPQGQGFEHNAYVLLVDGRGRQRVAWPVQVLTDDGLAHDIRVLQAEAGAG